MRALLLIAVVGCGSATPRPRGQPPRDLGEVHIDGDVFVRKELYGETVMARVTSAHAATVGVAWMPPGASDDPAAYAAIARARGWQDLARSDHEANAAFEQARTRVDPRGRVWLDTPIRDANDLVIRKEPDGSVGVVARAELRGATGWGYARLFHMGVDRAESSRDVRVARARAWHLLALLSRGDAQLAFDAATQGLEVIDACVYSDVTSRRHVVALSFQIPEKRERALADTIEMLRGAITSCVNRWQADVQ